MKTVLDYENVCLERKYPELRYQVEEYRNRLLLDKITGQEIQKRIGSDEAGLQTYFEKHRSDYQWREQRYKGIVLHGVSKRIVKQARKFLKSLPRRSITRLPNCWKQMIRGRLNNVIR